jgi:hypothetical protein
MAEKQPKIQTMLDPVVDRDIIDWYEAIPRMRRGEFVRTAIRLYMAQTGKGGGFIPLPGAAGGTSGESVEEIEKERIEPKDFDI